MKPGAVSEYSLITLSGVTVGFPGSSAVQNLSAVQETQEMWVRSLGQKDTLEEEMATLSSILAGKSHRQRSLVGYSLYRLQIVGHS